MTVNIFENPKYYLKAIHDGAVMNTQIISRLRDEFSGKAMMCAWLTKDCPLKCKSCFFRSNMNRGELLDEECCLSDEGIERLIHFVNESNNGYLMLSGGGDPMMVPKKVHKLITECESDRIVIVTSAFWAATPSSAEKTIDDLYRSYSSRVSSNGDCEVVIRLSVDEYHEEPLGGLHPFANVIDVFERKYHNVSGFSLLLHTMKGDTAVKRLADMIGAQVFDDSRGVSDNDCVIKIVPVKQRFITSEGMEIPVGVSKLFVSDLAVDLRNDKAEQVRSAVRVMTDDLENSEQGNPSYIQGTNGTKGLDFWVDYNGNVTTWFNQDWAKLYNLYTDTYDDVVEGTLSNPLTARFLKKGYEYRNGIIEEVNPRAVLRSKAVNLRDYAGALILEEDKTKLYYAIRCLADYVKEFELDATDLVRLPPEVQETILDKTRTELQELYRESSYDYCDQIFDPDLFSDRKWKDMLTLIALGHYCVDERKVLDAVSTYNDKTGQMLAWPSDFLLPLDDTSYARLHQRISFMKPEARKVFAA